MVPSDGFHFIFQRMLAEALIISCLQKEHVFFHPYKAFVGPVLSLQNGSRRLLVTMPPVNPGSPQRRMDTHTGAYSEPLTFPPWSCEAKVHTTAGHEDCFSP